MSTIEKAMLKLSGAAPEEETRADERSSFPALEDDAPGTVRAEDNPSGHVVAPVSMERQPGPDAVGTPGELPRATLKIDFERLRWLGFLAPGDPTTPLAEEFQEVKRKLIANMVPGVYRGDAPPNLVMVTSAMPDEGKTFTAMNLALSLALEIDRTVLAVDIDIIKSDLSRLFGAYNKVGLFDYLAHQALDVSDIIMRTNVPSLAFIPAGTVREGITERLASQAMLDLTRELAVRYPDRIIIFDAPPILATTGTAAVAPLMGQVVLVVEAYRTRREDLQVAIGAIERAHIAGLVLNKIRHRVAGRGYSGGNYAYAETLSERQVTK